MAAVRTALGTLAMTTPVMVSSHFTTYTGSVQDLLALAGRVVEHGVERAVHEQDEWRSFRSRS